MRAAVITGATGAIGSALVREMLANGVRVLALCRKEARLSHLPCHPLLSVRFCSLRELSTLQNDTGLHFDVFYHLAWEGTAGAARNDAALQLSNIQYALDAVGAAARFDCHRFVGVGSQAEYGRQTVALAPDTPTLPENGYGMAKLAAGGLTRITAEAAGLSHVWVRALSVYGPCDGAGSLVSSTVQKLLLGERPRFTPATQLWDFLYSADAARALFLLGEKGKNGGVYPLGSGDARPLSEFITVMRDEIAPDVPLVFGELPFTTGQVMHLVADISALTADTGFLPKISFAEGVRKTAAWWRERMFT